MLSDPIQFAYEQAKAQWPMVRWPMVQYQKHVGDAPLPRHPLDLYLGGAAGHRVTEAWQTIEQELAPQVCRRLTTKAKAGMSPEELWARARERLIEDDPDGPMLADGRTSAKIVRYRGVATLLAYLLVIAGRIAIDEHRRSKPSQSLDVHVEGHDSQPGDWEQQQPHAQAIHREARLQITRVLTRAYAQLTGEQQFLLRMVYREGIRQKQAAALLGVSEATASRRLESALQQFRDALSEVDETSWSEGLQQVWNECIEQCWAGVKESETTASA